jgi:acyl-CoA reductase-like NAD-dependent aldehyde dehydrogenase
MATSTAHKQSRTPINKTYKIFIGGKFPRTESGRYYQFSGVSESSSCSANICLSSRKDFRNAVVAARAAQSAWAAANAYLRGQIVYRIAEILEGRRDQFVAELKHQGASTKQANSEVDASIDRLVYFAGWSDKYQQIFSTVNPVSSSHFNFSVLEPSGVVAVLSPESDTTQFGLLSLVSSIAPIIIGGNTCVVLAEQSRPLTAISLAEVLQVSDVPGGIVNILTGSKSELVDFFASHKDVNCVVHSEASKAAITRIQQLASENLKRVIHRPSAQWHKDSMQNPYLIKDTQEVKTTWHPIGG